MTSRVVSEVRGSEYLDDTSHDGELETGVPGGTDARYMLTKGLA